jgi:hypothetical protein
MLPAILRLRELTGTRQEADTDRLADFDFEHREAIAALGSYAIPSHR